MSTIKEKFALQSLYTKIILAFLFGCIVVLFSWIIARFVFRETFLTIEKIGQPNPKLRIVNGLLVKVHDLDQVQRLNIMRQGKEALASIVNDSKSISRSLDTLQFLYAGDSMQVARLGHMKDILLQRDKLFLKYLEFHKELVHNRALASSMHELSDYISESVKRQDSAVVTVKQKIVTTTVDLPEEEEKRKQESFLKRLFSRKKTEIARKPARKQVTEHIITTADTLAIAQRDSFIRDMKSAIGTIEKDQNKKGTQLMRHEIKLANASNTFMTELQTILYQIQEEEIRSLQENTAQLSAVFHSAFNRVGLILFVFMLLTVSLIFLMFSDLSQSNRHGLELVEAKEKAQHMERVKERFLANMSHEIRTPLQSIIGYSEQLKNGQGSGTEYAEAIYRSSGYLLQIVNEILDYSRITSGKFKFENTAFSMEEVLAELADTTESMAEQKHILFKFKSDIPPGILHQGDSFRLKQILYNLLSNAVKFTAQGEVSLSVTSQSELRKTRFTFEVRDTGIGMDEQQLSYIFNAFEQASESTQRHFGGSGLGLSISKTLIDMQRGEISVSSKKGEGTLFTVRLGYLKAAPVEADAATGGPAPLPAFAGKVLVVDDDELILRLCSLIFRKHGIDHVCFQSAGELLKQPVDPEVRLALIDIRMPEINGIEVCRKLRELAPGRNIRYVALTAEALPCEIEQILSQGFDRILLKPFRENDLLHTLEETGNTRATGQESSDDFNLHTLCTMCGNDEAEFKKILQLMLSETWKDIGLLRQQSLEENPQMLQELFHKLAARTGQAGAVALCESLRHYEQKLGSGQSLRPKDRNDLIEALGRFAGKLQSAVNA